MRQQQSLSERIRTFLGGKSILPKLILINVLVWGLVNFGSVVAFLFTHQESVGVGAWEKFLLEWFAVPANWHVFIQKPWTVATYMFFHLDFWHLLFNMLWLYWFGKIFLEFLSNRHLTTIYLMGGIAGAFAFIAAFNGFPVFFDDLSGAIALGASASVLAVGVAISTLVPNYTLNLLFLGNIKLKYIIVLSILIDLFMIPKGNAGGHFAHFGGALAGVIFVLFLKQNIKLPTVFSFRFGKPKLKKMKRSSKEKESVYAVMTDEEYNLQRAKNQERINLILDKISKSGYSSLNKEEKELLFKLSDKE